MGLDRGKDRLQKGLTVNNDTVVLGTWEINKMSLVRMAEKGIKTLLHRGFTESTKNVLKTIKLTENTNIRKAMAIHWREASDGQEHWLMHWMWLKSNQTCTQANIYAGGVPSDHGQRQALVEPLLLPRVAWNVNEFLCETAQEGTMDLPYTPVVSIATGWK